MNKHEYDLEIKGDELNDVKIKCSCYEDVLGKLENYRGYDSFVLKDGNGLIRMLGKRIKYTPKWEIVF